MKFKLSFQEDIFRHQSSILFRLAVLEHKKTVKANLKRSAIYIGSTLILTVFERSFAYTVLYFLAYEIYKYLIDSQSFSEKRHHYYKELDKNVKMYSQEPYNQCLMEFNNDDFIYQDYTHSISIKWISVGGYRLLDENIFIFISKETPPYILGIKQVGQESFRKVVAHIAERIPEYK